MKYEYDFYENEDGISDTFEYIRKLSIGSSKDKSLVKSIYKKFEKLQRFGTWMGMPDIRHINTAKNNLWEIRVKFWEGYLRIFICLHPLRTNTYIVLNYFIKKDEKTPKSEIEKADRIMFLLKESVKLNEK